MKTIKILLSINLWGAVLGLIYVIFSGFGILEIIGAIIVIVVSGILVSSINKEIEEYTTMKKQMDVIQRTFALPNEMNNAKPLSNPEKPKTLFKEIDIQYLYGEKLDNPGWKRITVPSDLDTQDLVDEYVHKNKDTLSLPDKFDLINYTEIKK